jgi:hypothetical protein
MPGAVIDEGGKCPWTWPSIREAMPLFPVPGPQVRKDLSFIGTAEEHHHLVILIIGERMCIPDGKGVRRRTAARHVCYVQ